MSYTSRSEFDLEKRVHFTNEIPPYDMYDGLNSVLQNTLWQWVLGYTKVEFNLPYTVTVADYDANGEISGYHTDRDVGIDNEEVYYKMVNGTVVEDVQYGPASDSGETYHRLEEYGVLIPEFDYLLHEVYRYLGSMYPDHPDMINLLTANEFDDMITNAGSVIDYVPDNKFFEEVANSLNLSSSSDIDLEAAMLKIRNLKNEGFRKRLYGSKMGYRMLANDIFQTATVFPVATYLPIKPVDKDTLSSELRKYEKDSDGNYVYDSDGNLIPYSPLTDADKLKTWNDANGYNYKASQYEDYIKKNNRIIDTYSKYYYKKFRLADWDGSNSSYPEPEDKNLYIFGYTIPFHDYDIFEYPACSDAESEISNATYSSTVTNSNYESDTNYVLSRNDDIPENIISYTFMNTYFNNVKVSESTASEVHSIKTSLRNYVPYTKVYTLPHMVDVTLDTDHYNAVYNKNDKVLINKTARDNPKYNFLSCYYQTYLASGFTSEEIAEVEKSIDVVMNPFVKGTLILKPSDSISFYPHTVTLRSNDNGDYTFNQTDLVWSVVSKGDYIITTDVSTKGIDSIDVVEEISNFTKGFIEWSIDSDAAIEASQLVQLDDFGDDRFAVVVENEDGDLIFLEGRLDITTNYQNGRYILTSEKFYIGAIPETKTPDMMSTIYGDDYLNALKETKSSGFNSSKGESPVTLRDTVDLYIAAGYDEQVARDYYSDDDEKYKAAKATITESTLDSYTAFLTAVKNLIAVEEQIADWKQNSSHLYKTTTYTKDGETVSTEAALVYPGLNVKYVLKGNVPATIDSTISEYNITYDETTGLEISREYNDDYNQNKVTYNISSIYVPGEITNISMGNLNLVCLYDYTSGNITIPSGKQIVEDTITVTNSDTNESFDYHYIKADENVTEHDNETIKDFDNIDTDIRNYYEQSFSSTCDGFNTYCSGYSSDTKNITITPIEREDIQIESVIDVNTEGYERIIKFESDTAKEMSKSLSVGDIITGPSIDSDDNDVFIVDVGDNEVTVNVDLQQSGTFVLTYSVKTNVSPTDVSNNMTQYKEDLYNNGLYSVTNPFEHGLWPSTDYPNVSTAILDSLPDVSFYNATNVIANSGNSFTRIITETHEDDIEDGKYLIPSDIKFNNDLFLELNLNKLLYYPTRSSSTTPVLMSVDWLDYLEDSLSYSSRATDNVNVGVNLMMETDTSGYYTLIDEQAYTDPQIHLKFITLNLNGQNMWPEKSSGDYDWTIPCYAQIGTAGSGRKKWFKSPSDITYPSVYGATVYDDIKDASTYDEDSDFYQQNGELRNVGVYGQDLSTTSSTVNTTKYTSVESPLFEIPLGEYDTIIKYNSPIDYTNATNLLSITQASFYAQTFTNLIKYLGEEEKAIKLIGSDVTESNILVGYGSDSTNIFTYAGDWTPTKSAVYENGVITNYYELVYPESPLNMTYYVITEDTYLTQLGSDMSSKSFTRSDVLFRYNDNWYLRSFQFMGLIGDSLDTITIDALGQATRNVVTPENNHAVSEKGTDNNPNGAKEKTFTLLERLMQYYLRASGIFNSNYTENIIPNLSFDEPYYLDADTTYTINSGFKEIDNSKSVDNIYLDHILYYMYIGTFKYDSSVGYPKSTSMDRDWLGDDFSGFITKEGQRLALTNIDGNWFFFRINTDSMLGASLPISQWHDVFSSEIDAIAGDNSTAQSAGWDIQSRIDEFSSVFDLPRNYVTEGSYNFDFIVDPHFISEGYEYEDDGTTVDTTKDPIKFCTTKGAIYYDSDNDVFYCYSNIVGSDGNLDNSTHKIAIKFNEQKYFKNVLNIAGVYQLKNTIATGETEATQTPTFTAINGVEFPLDKLATGDRLLQVKSMDLRSVYSTSLEPVFFSNYYTVDFPIKGVTENNEIYLSYIPEGGDVVEKFNFITNVQSLLPVVNTYDSTTATYTTSLLTDETTIKFGETDDLPKPELSSISVTKALLSDSYASDTPEKSTVSREFGYFKNNLVVRGKINTISPKTVTVPSIDASYFRNAIQSISIGDTLVGAYALSETGSEEKYEITIKNAEDGKTVTDAIQYAYFANSQFRAVTTSGILYYNDSVDISNVTKEVSCYRTYIWSTNDAKSYQGDIESIQYSKDLGWYIEVINSSSTSTTNDSVGSTTILSMTLFTDGTVSLTPSYSSIGKKVFIEGGYNSSTDTYTDHTVVGHTIDEYSNDYTVPSTMTLTLSDKSKQWGVVLKNENTATSIDDNDLEVWTTSVSNADGTLNYISKVTLSEQVEMVKSEITALDNRAGVESSDASKSVSFDYKIERYDASGNVTLTAFYSSDSSVPKYCYYLNSSNNLVKDTGCSIYIQYDDPIWNTYQYRSDTTEDTNEYTYENSNDVIENMNENGVVAGLEDGYDTTGGTITAKDTLVKYSDVVLSYGKLKQRKDDTDIYDVESSYISMPYFVDTAAVVNTDLSKSPISTDSMTRSIMVNDNSGKYSVYAKGRTLFVKSPVKTVELDSTTNTYEYDGNVTTGSYWKSASAPIFNDKTFVNVRSKILKSKDDVLKLITNSASALMYILFYGVDLSIDVNYDITVDGRALSSDYDNKLVSNLKAVYKQLLGYDNSESLPSNMKFSSIFDYQQFVDTMEYTKLHTNVFYTVSSNPSAEAIKSTLKKSTWSPISIKLDSTTNAWTFRCYGYRIIEETITDSMSVIGASKKKFIELAPTEDDILTYYTDFTMNNDMTTPNYEWAYSMYAYYTAYYLLGNGADSDIVTSTNISNITFTNTSMIVTDVYGNVNTINLYNLHSREDIENPDNWSKSTFPGSLTLTAKDSSLVGTTHIKYNGSYIAIPKQASYTNVPTFRVKCSYANDNIILLGGYLMSKTDIKDFYKKSIVNSEAVSEADLETYMNNLSDSEKEFYDSLVNEASFTYITTPIVLYSTDGGNTFERMSLSRSTTNVSNGDTMPWESSANDASGSSDNYYISAILFANSEYKIFAHKDGDDTNLSYYYEIAADDETGLFDFSETTGLVAMDEYGDISNAHEFDIDATTGTDDTDDTTTTDNIYTAAQPSTSASPSGSYRLMFTEGDTKFYILTTKGISSGSNITVTSRTASSITFSSNLVKQGTSSFDVLLSFKTSADITDSLAFVNKSRFSDYMNNAGTFYVPEVSIVDDKSNADRFYSYREILTSQERTVDPYGYPATAEDTSYAFYEYDTVTDTDTNLETYVPTVMTNDDGNNVKLCSSNGNYLVYTTDESSEDFEFAMAKKRASLPTDLFKNAYIPVYDTVEDAESSSTARLSDDTFLKCINTTGSSILSLCYDSGTPNIKVSTSNTNLASDLYQYLFAESDVDAFTNYLRVTTAEITDTYYANATSSVEEQELEAIANITYVSGTNSATGASTISSKYTCKTAYTTTEDIISLVDGKEVITKDATVEHKCWYDNESGQFLLKSKRYFNALAYMPFTFAGGLTAYKNVGFPTVWGEGETELDNPITGVYLSNYGYGGSRTNTDLWENTLPWVIDPDAFTTDYLTNTNGENVYLVDAGGAEIKSYNAETERTVGDRYTVDVSNLNGSESKDLYVYESKSNMYTQKIYNLPKGDVSVYTPVSSITLGATDMSLSLFAFRTNKLVDIDLKSDGTPNIKFNYYGWTAKNKYSYIRADLQDSVTTTVVDEETGEEKQVTTTPTPDFTYDPTTKCIKYTYSKDTSILRNKLYVNTEGETSVTKLVVTFYIDGTAYSVTYSVTLGLDNPKYEKVLNEDGTSTRKICIGGDSSWSIVANKYAIYQSTNDTSNPYRLVSYNFGNETFGNETSISFSATNTSGNVGLSFTNINNNCISNSQQETDGSYTLSISQFVTTPKDTVQVTGGNITGTVTITAPIFTLGEVKTFGNVTYTKNESTSDYDTSINYQTFIDDTKISQETYTVSNGTTTVYLPTANSSDKYELNSIATPSPVTSGYVLNFKNGYVMYDGLQSVDVEIIKIDPENELSDNVYTNGSYGRVPCRMPKYDTFKDLLNQKSYVIDAGADTLLLSYTGTSLTDISAVDSDNSAVSFSEQLDIDGYNDGNEHFVLMKWLTQATIRTTIDITQDTDAFTEISLSDKTLFTPDRVWFNPDGYPTPTVTIGNSIYNIDNNSEYGSSYYKNNNGYSIYRCNESGYLVGYAQSSGTVAEAYDTDNDGVPENVEGYLLNSDGSIASVATEFVLDPTSNSLSDAQIPLTPSYESCQDWFKNEFYLQGKESNPYWQVIRISSKFDNAKKSWQQYYSVNEYVRSSQDMTLEEIEEADRFLNVSKTTKFTHSNNSYTITPDADLVDLTDGSIRFLLSKPSSKYQTEEQFIKYGITATNPFYGSKIWQGETVYSASYINSTYTVCSTKNLADPSDTDSEVQEVTELGLFNKDHQLIAYAVFPPIEYRTSSQHISFTCYVKQGSCVDPNSLV